MIACGKSANEGLCKTSMGIMSWEFALATQWYNQNSQDEYCVNKIKRLLEALLYGPI